MSRLEKAEWWFLGFSLLVGEAGHLFSHLLATCVPSVGTTSDSLHAPHYLAAVDSPSWIHVPGSRLGSGVFPAAGLLELGLGAALNILPPGG